MNVIILTGNATKDPEIKYNDKGTAICNGTIAVRRSRKDQDGEYKSDFHNFIAFGKLGELIANSVKKGDKFGVKGELQNRVWEKENGEKRYFTEVIADGFDFPSKPSSGGGSTNTSSNNRNANTGGNTRVADDPFGGGQTVQFDDESLPF